MESAREDRAPWLGDHDLSAPQTVQPSTVEQRCVGSDSSEPRRLHPLFFPMAGDNYIYPLTTITLTHEKQV